jgi:ubiquitin fusion degradation protein 1
MSRALKRRLRVVSLSNRGNLDLGGKVLLPASFLRDYIHLYPEEENKSVMLFRIRSLETGKLVHCGALEFTALTGTVAMPAWMAKSIGSIPGAADLVHVQMIDLPVARSEFDI